MRRSPRFTERWDTWLFLAAALLTLCGGIAMASATATLNPSLAVRHGGWAVVGILVSFGVAGANVRRWANLAWIAYGGCLLALALVPIAGAMRLGATRWLSIFGLSVQPSEMMKLATIWVLAGHLAGQPAPLPGRVLWTSLALVAPPALLVFFQPDLGSASVFGAIWLGMVWTAGISRRGLGGLVGVSLTLLPLGWFLLKDYQRERLMVFLNPHLDPLGAGYTMIQSTIAIGSGQVWGRGWFAGTQNQLSFLPERHSDFIFSVIGEEWGLVGCLIVVGLFFALCVRVLRVARGAPDPQGRAFAAGVCAWIAYQAVVNMGMVMGLLPVVGVPLPLLSYGGSSMISVWVALGLLQSIRRPRVS